MAGSRLQRARDTLIKKSIMIRRRVYNVIYQEISMGRFTAVGFAALLIQERGRWINIRGATRPYRVK
jgi:hypothetical protein